MNLGEFHSTVSDALKRGSSLDGVIPGYVRRAARYIERNYTFLYMREYFETTLTAGERLITLPSNLYKQIEFFRWRNTEGEFQYLRSINPRDQSSNTSEDGPTGYWRSGARNLILDASADEDRTGEFQIVRLTDWPISLTATHWLIDVAEDVLLARTLMAAGVGQRDVAIYAMYEKDFAAGVKSLIDSEEEAKHDNSDEVMFFQPSYALTEWTPDGS